MIFNREPVRWIGIIVSCILAVVSILSSEGVLNDAVKGQITDAVNAIAQLLMLIAPIIAAELARRQVTPTSNPILDSGTVVTVITPEGQPNRETIL